MGRAEGKVGSQDETGPSFQKKKIQTSSCKISHGDVMYIMVTTVKTVLHV